jgi:hypothetical protein
MLAFLVLIGASVWEGSAAVSLAGELPEGAYYAATNSFPRNTVVDVTNLENGRTIRVIVAAGLDSPGLLAMLSRNAATAIGVPLQGIGRIRMTAPSDPVAFSRFTEEGELSDGQNAAQPDGNAVVSSTLRTATAEELSASTPEDRFYNAMVNNPESYMPPAMAYPQDGSVHVEPQPMWILKEAPPEPDIGEMSYPGLPSSLADAEPAESPNAHETSPDASGPTPGDQQITSPDASGPTLGDQQITSPYPYMAPPAEAPVYPQDSVMTLEKAEDHSPQGPMTPERNLLPVPPPPQQAGAAGDDVYLDPRYFIGPIPRLWPPLFSAGVLALSPLPPQQAGAAGDDVYLDPRYFIGPIPQPLWPPRLPARALDPPLPAPQIAAPPRPAPHQVESLFSVPIIKEFEAGKRYVQIGAFVRPDTLENAVTRAGRGYPLAIQTDSSKDVLMYRLLIGPLTAGESAAVLQRVKTKDFPDAFIR